MTKNSIFDKVLILSAVRAAVWPFLETGNMPKGRQTHHEKISKSAKLSQAIFTVTQNLVPPTRLGENTPRSGSGKRRRSLGRRVITFKLVFHRPISSAWDSARRWPGAAASPAGPALACSSPPRQTPPPPRPRSHQPHPRRLHPRRPRTCPASPPPPSSSHPHGTEPPAASVGAARHPASTSATRAASARHQSLSPPGTPGEPRRPAPTRAPRASPSPRHPQSRAEPRGRRCQWNDDAPPRRGPPRSRPSP